MPAQNTEVTELVNCFFRFILWNFQLPFQYICGRDLSFNRGLTGSLTPRLGDLRKQNDGLDTGSTSTSSSVKDFGATKGVLKHPYDALTKKDTTYSAYGGAFDYSGGYSLSPKIEPK